MPGVRQLTGTGIPAASMTMSLPATPISVRACAGVTAKFAVVGGNPRLPVKNGRARPSPRSRQPPRRRLGPPAGGGRGVPALRFDARMGAARDMNRLVEGELRVGTRRGDG